MLVVVIIYLVDWSEWARPMVMKPKKHYPKKLCICVNFRGLNKVTLIDPFPIPFVTKSLMKLQVPIAKEDHHKKTFMCVFG